MTDTTTEAVQALLESVTPGPWAWEESHPTNACAEVTAEIVGGWPFALATLYGSSEEVPSPTEPDEPWGDHPIRRANARFIAAARDLVPALLADRDRLATAHAQMQQTLDRLAADNDRMRKLADDVSDPDFLFGAMDNVADMDTGLMDYAEAASRAISAALAASTPADPVTNADSQQPEGTNGQ